MEYRPSLPEHNDNISHDRPVREFLVLFSGVTIIFLMVFWVLGLLVDRAVDYISPEMEGVIFSPFNVSASELKEDGEPQELELQRLVDELRKCIHIDYPLKVNIMNSEDVNAIALPGGRIIVLSGLMDKVQSENGLSFVLAHELAHFKNRDHLRGLGRGIVLTALMAYLTGAGSDLTQVVAPSTALSQAKYSQEREKMADLEALQTLNCYYGHVGGATEFFEVMKSKEKSKIVGHYFASHPEAVQRIENLQSMVTTMNMRLKDVLPLPAVLAGHP